MVNCSISSDSSVGFIVIRKSGHIYIRHRQITIIVIMNNHTHNIIYNMYIHLEKKLNIQYCLCQLIIEMMYLLLFFLLGITKNTKNKQKKKNNNNNVVLNVK